MAQWPNKLFLLVGRPWAGHRNCPKNLRLSKATDMTIHWKALGKHFQMVPFVSRFNQFSGENAFSVFSFKKIP
jgi:hypothetical protein